MRQIKFTALIVLALSLTACGSKDPNYAAKFAVNGMGATVANGTTTASAAATAEADGVTVDITSMNVSSVDDGSTAITSIISLNGQTGSITTFHTGNEQNGGTITINGYTVDYDALCLDSCSTYYISVNVMSSTGSLIVQEGVRKSFATYDSDTGAGTAIYQMFAAADALTTFVNTSNLNDPNTMVGYLSTATAETSQLSYTDPSLDVGGGAVM